MNKPRSDKGQIHRHTRDQSPILDEYHLDISGPYADGLYYWQVTFEYMGVGYEQMGSAEDLGGCWQGVAHYRQSVTLHGCDGVITA